MMIGERFTRLTVLELGLRKYGKRAARCRCDCGAERVIPERHLVIGNTTSCGCRHRDVAGEQIVKLSTRHGGSGRGRWAPEYSSWSSMVQRCTNPNNPSWPDYGGRGIAVCQRWLDASSFLLDMGRRPPGTTLDRIDNTKGYEPGNCRWATVTVQNRNRRSTKLTRESVADIRSSTASGGEMAAKYGVTPGYVRRLRNGEKWAAA